MEGAGVTMEKRALVYAVFNLSYPDRMRVFLDLGLLTDSDKSLPDTDMVRNALKRAVDEGKYDKLVEAVKKKEKPETGLNETSEFVDRLRMAATGFIPESKRKDRDLFCQKCMKVLSCRFQPSLDAGPFWRCSECSEVVECAGDEVEKMMSEATSLWYAEYDKGKHRHCFPGHPGHEGCAGGVPCPYRGSSHDDVHTIRSILYALDEVLKMKLGLYCCSAPVQIDIPKCRHGAPGWCNICGVVPPASVPSHTTTSNRLCANGTDIVTAAENLLSYWEKSSEQGWREDTTVELDQLIKALGVTILRQKMMEAPLMDPDLHMGGEGEAKRGKAWLERAGHQGSATGLSGGCGCHVQGPLGEPGDPNWGLCAGEDSSGKAK